ncbi:MmpL protein [Mycobacterium colombiense]|uniref:MmpL protein n=1 Tax=Mycobacterium colombiense TaxID=339268 RepID=A0A329K7Y2_9MYCO|nr:MmpL protein [Mycobacterium colombiense]
MPGNRSDDSDAAEPTTALPKMRAGGSGLNDPNAATEQVNAHEQDENGDPARQRRRSGGGLSAQDLLRREGRL